MSPGLNIKERGLSTLGIVVRFHPLIDLPTKTGGMS